MRGVQSTRSANSLILFLLFFVSGAAGLSYEVLWFKMFSHVWGSSTFALASVVSAFLLGLGLGASAGQLVSSRIHNHLLWYGFCELGIGILALLLPLEITFCQWALKQYQ